MNTANLQLEGLYAAVAALASALRAKGLLSGDEIEAALAGAEATLAADSHRGDVSAANADAILFPLRYLRLANRLSSENKQLSFTELATMVGLSKPDRREGRADRPAG